MRLTSAARYAIGVPCIAGAVLATTAVRTSPLQTPLGRACAATIADMVPLGSNPVDIPVKFSDPMGDSLTATFSEGSGVTVVSIMRGKNDGPTSAMLTLNTMRASAGSWDVNVHSEMGECVGKVKVGVTAAAPSGAKATAAKPAGHKECAAFMNDSISMGLDRTETTVNYSEPIGDNLSARFPKEAGVDVIGVKRNPGDDPLSARMTLNTVRAVTGQWKLELTGDANMCTGMVYVGKKR